MSASAARQRTAAQRRPKDDDLMNGDTAILDSQEQEAEIAALRRKNAADNRRNRRITDVGVLIAMGRTVPLLAYLVTRSILGPLAILQLLLLPLSLSPSRLAFLPIPQVYLARAQASHSYTVAAQVCLFALAAWTLYDRDEGVVVVLRWALPVLVAAVVEVQRQGEGDVMRQLDGLEGLKYDLRGA